MVDLIYRSPPTSTGARTEEIKRSRGRPIYTMRPYTGNVTSLYCTRVMVPTRQHTTLRRLIMACDAISRQKYLPTLLQAKAPCRTAPSHYLNQEKLTPYSPGSVISIVSDQGHNSRFSFNWRYNYDRTSWPFTTGPVRCQLSCRPMNVQVMNKRCVAKCQITMMLQSICKNTNIKKYGQTNL